MKKWLPQQRVTDRVASLDFLQYLASLERDIAAGGGGGATNLSYNAATRALGSSTGTGVTLPLLSSSNAGLAPASGGGTANFLRADGTWAAPSGGGGGPSPIISWVI
jgi:hypothetical protein